MIEIHGKRMCPFAWRARICAREKGIAFDWLPFDAHPPDPRAVRGNPEQKSPKLVDGDFELIESLVILQYLDEAHPGVSLQPLRARDRALLRLRLEKLAALEQHVTPENPPDREKLRQGFDALEEALADGRTWMGGASPDLSDVAVWPFLFMLERRESRCDPRSTGGAPGRATRSRRPALDDPRSILEQLARDDHPLDLARALVDGGDPRVAVVALGGELVEVPVSTVHLHAHVARLVGLLGGEDLGHRSFARERLARFLQRRRAQA